MIKVFKSQKSLDKKNMLLRAINLHEFNCILHEKPYNRKASFCNREYYEITLYLIN